MTPLIIVALIANSIYYPISDFTGSQFCYVYSYSYLWICTYGQAMTFFITIFRYICLYHERKLICYGMNANVSKSIIYQIWMIFHIIFLLLKLDAWTSLGNYPSCNYTLFDLFNINCKPRKQSIK